MKMKVGTRIIFSLVMLMIIAICVLIVLSVVGIIPQANIDALYSGFTNGYGWIWAAAACIIAIICLCLLFFGIGKSKVRTVNISDNLDGAVVIVIEAFRELVKRYLDSKSEVITQSITVKPVEKRNVKLELHLAAKPETDIPLIADEIKSGLKEYLEMYSGVTASSISIIIDPYRQQNL